ncbi:hypothetical protein EHW64_20465 [Erwinia psidii]|uniref:hypothetical protein n=1 Tax=Erwinia psidii TaxID=69224 RepID=UPI00226BB2A4|nr:hypothetical protein [Erwinia psidii]MCX8963412.1 hypothetical protein [Erwinia psidii]
MLSFKKNVVIFFALLTLNPLFAMPANSSVLQSVSVPANLTMDDFFVDISGHKLGIGNKWNEKTAHFFGKEQSRQFVGDIPAGDTSYKFWQHNYAGYSVYSSNVYWDKEERSVDDYIIAQITISSPVIMTNRGVKVGDSEEQLINKYGAGNEDDSDGQHWRIFENDSKRIGFQIENKKVTNINIIFRLDD